MKELVLKKGEVGLFGYGSLMLKESMEKTLGRSYDKPMYEVVLKGWKRSWSVRYPNSTFYYIDEGEEICPDNIVYLNIEPEKSEKVNGILIVISEGELEEFDRRESVYNRVYATRCIEGLSVKGGEVFTYQAQPEYFIENPHAFKDGVIRRSYMNMVYKAIEGYGKGFMSEYFSTTDSLPEALVVEDFMK